MAQTAGGWKLLRIENAAEALDVSHWTLRLWAKQRRLKTVRVGNRLMIPASEVARIARQGMPSAVSKV